MQNFIWKTTGALHKCNKMEYPRTNCKNYEIVAFKIAVAEQKTVSIGHDFNITVSDTQVGSAFLLQKNRKAGSYLFDPLIIQIIYIEAIGICHDMKFDKTLRRN